MFKFLSGKKSMEDMYIRTINPNLYGEVRVNSLVNFRWIHISISNLHFRIYTHLSLGEVEHNVTNIIEPLLFESNNHENVTTILRWLGSRFHRAQIVEDEGL